MNSWSDELIATSREMLELENVTMVKSLDNQYGFAIKQEDGTYSVILRTSKTKSAYDSLNALIKAGWVID